MIDSTRKARPRRRKTNPRSAVLTRHLNCICTGNNFSRVLHQTRARDLAARMADLAGGMWRQAADAWYQRDRSAAAALAGRAREMDELHAALTAELASGQVTTPVAMEMTLVARCYQRLGAHAVNIARRAGYLAGSAGG